MSHKIAAVSVVLVVVLAGAAGLVHAGASDGPVAQTDTPSETPSDDANATETPTPESPATGDSDTAPGGETTTAANSTITVSASASESASPDTAIVRLAVVATADEADAAREQVATDLQETRTALREFGIEDDQVRTTRFDISVVRDRPRPEAQPDNRSDQIRATHEFEVEVTPNQTGAVIDTALGNGTNRVTGITFTLTDETRQELRGQALQEAMTSARADAEVIASSENVTITGLKSVSTADVGFFPFERSGDAVAEGAATAIEPGPVEVSATVTVTYRAD